MTCYCVFAVVCIIPVLVIFLHDSNEIKDLQRKLEKELENVQNMEKEGEEIKKENKELESEINNLNKNMQEKLKNFKKENESNLQIITEKK